MMYKLKHKLFGRDYILWRNSASSGIAEIITLPDGTIGYWRYKSIDVFDVIKSPGQVLWLTCLPSKYFPQASVKTSAEERRDIVDATLDIVAKRMTVIINKDIEKEINDLIKNGINNDKA